MKHHPFIEGFIRGFTLLNDIAALELKIKELRAKLRALKKLKKQAGI